MGLQHILLKMIISVRPPDRSVPAFFTIFKHHLESREFLPKHRRELKAEENRHHLYSATFLAAHLTFPLMSVQASAACLLLPHLLLSPAVVFDTMAHFYVVEKHVNERLSAAPSERIKGKRIMREVSYPTSIFYILNMSLILKKGFAAKPALKKRETWLSLMLTHST